MYSVRRPAVALIKFLKPAEFLTRTLSTSASPASVFDEDHRFLSRGNGQGMKEGQHNILTTYACDLDPLNKDDVSFIKAIVEADSRKLYFSSPQMAEKPAANDPTSERPDPDLIDKVAKVLQKQLEKTFIESYDYTMYHQNIIFIDNIRNIRTEGLPKYMQHVALLRTVGHLKYAFVTFEVLNMSTSHEEGRITVRWRIRGLSGMRVMLKFWKYKLWKWQELMKQQETWHDGISYFDVGSDGKIFRHIADKVMEDKDRQIDEKPPGGSIPLAAKLGALATVFPTPSSLMNGNASHSSTMAGSLPAS